MNNRPTRWAPDREPAAPGLALDPEPHVDGHLPLGSTVVCADGHLAGVDPFTALRVIHVRPDGAVDLTDADPSRIEGGARTWLRVDPTHLIRPA